MQVVHVLLRMLLRLLCGMKDKLHEMLYSSMLVAAARVVLLTKQ